MVCSCVIPSKSVFAASNILLMRNCNHARITEKETEFCQQRTLTASLKKYQNKYQSTKLM